MPATVRYAIVWPRFITFDTGLLTERVYTSDSASFADGLGMCNTLLQRFSLATLPPS